jgi:hypothetical protein
VTEPQPERPIPLSSGLPIGVAFGACIWLLSASFTGRLEPWDSEGLYYPAALVGAGLVGGFLVPTHWVEVAVGIFTGQGLVLLGRAMSEPGSGGLWPLGMVVLAMYTLLALLGGAVGSGLRRLLTRTPG